MPVPSEKTDAYTQQLAMLSFDSIRKEHLHELPDLSKHLAHDGRVSDFRSFQLDSGLYVRPDITLDLKSGKMPDRISIVPNQLLRIGKEDSQHAVFFGNLAVRLFNKPTTKDQTIVAVKPFEDAHSMNRGLQELAISQHLGKVGASIINPFGLLVGNRTDVKSSMYLLSRYVPLVTLDSFEWDKMTTTDMDRKVEMIAEALADLHSNLIFHGDAVLRNFASLESVDKLHLVDFEYAVSLADFDKKSTSHNRLKQCMSADITSITHDISNLFIKYVDGFKNYNELEKFEFILKKFYMPYSNRIILKHGSKAKALKICYEIVVEEHARQATGEW